MAEPVLNAPRVLAGIGQGVAAGVPERVEVGRKGEARTRADALDEPIDRVGPERPDALSAEYERGVRSLDRCLSGATARLHRDGARRFCDEGSRSIRNGYCFRCNGDTTARRRICICNSCAIRLCGSMRSAWRYSPSAASVIESVRIIA